LLFKVDEDTRLLAALAAVIYAFSPQLETLVHGALLRTGSANWFPTGLKRQDNDLRYEADPALARQFEARFTEMWERQRQGVAPRLPEIPDYRKYKVPAGYEVRLNDFLEQTWSLAAQSHERCNLAFCRDSLRQEGMELFGSSNPRIERAAAALLAQFVYEATPISELASSISMPRCSGGSAFGNAPPGASCGSPQRDQYAAVRESEQQSVQRRLRSYHRSKWWSDWQQDH